MPTPRELCDTMREACDHCLDAHENKIDALESEIMALKDKRDDLLEELERVALERDEAKERYVELVETTTRRTDQAQG